MLRYATVCSGINACAAAWNSLGWSETFCSEIEAFPSAALHHHYPHVPNLGDMNHFKDWPTYGNGTGIDLLAGGTPCQAFSVAGLREGLADPRGNLTLVYLGVIAKYRPRWVVWENVPGVLSDKTGAFGALLGGLAELGYGFSYRVLDAQYVRVDSHGRAVPQRRKRVFVVGHIGGLWQRAAAVLLEPGCLRGDPPPSRKAWQGTAAGFECGPQGGRFTDLSPTLDARCKDGPIRNQLGVGVVAGFDCQQGGDTQHGYTEGGTPPLRGKGGRVCVAEVSPSVTSKWAKGSAGPAGDECQNLVPVVNLNHTAVAPTLRAGGNKTGGDRPPGTDVDTCESLIAFDTAQITSKANRCAPEPGDPCHPLAAAAHPPAIAFNMHKSGHEASSLGIAEERTDCLRAFEKSPFAIATFQQSSMAGKGTIGFDDSGVAKPCKTQVDGQMILTTAAVRRLTPRECERLMGFPDDFTLIPWRGKPASRCPDGPRYKALGNSMCVNVMRWLGLRIQMLEDAVPFNE